MPDRPPPTAEDFRARARELRAEADRLDAAAETMERYAAIKSTLPPGEPYATVATMATANVATVPAFRRGAPLESDGPVATMARRLGISSAEVARKLGVNPGTARNWDKRGKVPNEMMRAKLAALAPSKSTKNTRS